MKAVILEVTRQLSDGKNDRGVWRLKLCQASVDGQDKEITIFETDSQPINRGWEYTGTLQPARKEGESPCFKIDPKVEPVVREVPKTTPLVPTTPAETVNNYPHDLSARQTALKAATELTAAVLKLCCITEGCGIGEFYWNKEKVDLRIYVKALADDLYQDYLMRAK